MGLFKPVWMRQHPQTNSDREKIYRSVDKVKDQAKLLEIVNTAPLYGTCIRAAERLTDQAILADVARNHDCAGVCRIVVWKLEDQSVLEEIAKNKKDSSVRIEAVKKLTNNSVLKDIAMNDADVWVCEEAIMRLTGKKSTLEAIKALTDRDLLEKIAQHFRNNREKRLAIIKLNALQEDKTEHTGEHQWVYHDLCFRECSICGVLEHDHHYAKYLKSCFEYGYDEYTISCVKCGDAGHVYENHFVPDQNTDTRQTGPVNLNDDF